MNASAVGLIALVLSYKYNYIPEFFYNLGVVVGGVYVILLTYEIYQLQKGNPKYIERL